MLNPASHVAGAATALAIIVALAHCTGAGSGDPRFTHPYNGPQNGSSTMSPSPGDGTAVTGSNGSLLSGATPGTGTPGVAGTIKGLTFTPTVALFDATGPDPNTPQALTVVLASDANFCTALVSQGNLIANSNYALIQAIALDGSSATTTIAPGTYNIVLSSALVSQTDPGNYASFDFYNLDNQCLQSLADSYFRALTGTLSLTALSANPSSPVATGSMALSVGAQKDTVAVNFQAAPCPGLHDITGDPNYFGCE